MTWRGEGGGGARRVALAAAAMCALTSAPVSPVRAQHASQAAVSRPPGMGAAVHDAAVIAAASYGGSAMGALVAMAASTNHCDDGSRAGSPPGAGLGCLFGLISRAEAGAIGGYAVGFSLSSVLLARTHGCSTLAAVTHALKGAVLGAVPAVLVSVSTEEPNAWRGRAVGFTPLVQAVTTAAAIRSCHAATAG